MEYEVYTALLAKYADKIVEKDDKYLCFSIDVRGEIIDIWSRQIGPRFIRQPSCFVDVETLRKGAVRTPDRHMYSETVIEDVLRDVYAAIEFLLRGPRV